MPAHSHTVQIFCPRCRELAVTLTEVAESPATVAAKAQAQFNTQASSHKAGTCTPWKAR